MGHKWPKMFILIITKVHEIYIEWTKHSIGWKHNNLQEMQQDLDGSSIWARETIWLCFERDYEGCHQDGRTVEIDNAWGTLKIAKWVGIFFIKNIIL